VVIGKSNFLSLLLLQLSHFPPHTCLRRVGRLIFSYHKIINPEQEMPIVGSTGKSNRVRKHKANFNKRIKAFFESEGTMKATA